MSRERRQQDAELQRKIARVDRTLQALRQRGLDPLLVLRRAVVKHDRQQGSLDSPPGSTSDNRG